MWSGRCASVGVITKGVNVNTSLSIGVVSSDIIGNSGRGGLGFLFEGNGALDTGVTTDNSNCVTA